MTPYERHAEFGHKTTWHSPDGINKVEECADCGQRWIHKWEEKYPLTLSSLGDNDADTTGERPSPQDSRRW